MSVLDYTSFFCSPSHVFSKVFDIYTMPTRRRRASHAGSWYESSPERLRRSLMSWIQHAAARNGRPTPGKIVHALIAPHAAYSYSGSTAAYSYAPVNPNQFSRIILLGPSHHVYLRDRCAVSTADILDTPLGSIQVDKDVTQGLLEHSSRNARFVPMSEDMDEAEHSIEMHLPFIRHVFSNEVKIVPILVGSLSEEKEQQFGRTFFPWLGDGETFFVVSTDFCHWGTRFRFTRVSGDSTYIWQSIENMDREAMSIIQSGNHAAYYAYHRRTENTICGRHAIGVLLSALAYCTDHSNEAFSIRFLRYKQSTRCVRMSDSSVSYASGIVEATDRTGQSSTMRGRSTRSR